MASEDVAAGRKRKRAESPSNSSLGFTHEVFLSFRGPDTREGFTDHLYSRLVDAGIQVFRDDENLPAGEEIKLELKKAIKRSRISIAIFSKDYTSSEHCLMELKQMWECRQSDGQILIPIFYHVSPSDLKNPAGAFVRSLKKHDDKVDANTSKTWREVLAEIKKLRGYELKNVKKGYESELVKVVLRRVREVLKKDDQVLPDKLVGIDCHVQEMMRKLGVVYRDGQANKVYGGDVRVVGICGVRGVGKTTLAKVVYNKMHFLFDECSFLEDMKLEEVTSLQERLIATLQKRKREALNSYSAGIKKMKSFSQMKVLIVLDDVCEDKQIEGLVGNPTWFGPGSKIIVTTDNENVLNGYNGAVEKYKVRPMEPHHALQLFRQFAFQGNAPQDYEYDSLSIDIIKAIGGLPMAIILQASNLSKKRSDIETWRYTSEYLRNHPPEDVTPLFKDGYESLNFREKRIFLDIACFFTGNDERIPPYMWKACDCYCPSGIDSLRNLHWLEKGENNELRMHNLIRDFGRDIVKSKVVHQRCRFWNHSDALEILENPRGSESVEGIGLTVEEGHVDSFKCEGFREMPNLRYLRLNRANIQGETKNLPSNLRWLDWRDCHSIPELHDTHLKKLVILDLSRSLVAQDPKIWSRIMEKVEKLKVLNLQGCGLSGASLKFQAPIHLEILILEDCTQLSEIGTFISKLKGLKSLNLRNCKGVKQLPRQLHLMKYLKELLIDGTDIKRINIENGSLKDLEVLSACRCGKLEYISPIGHLAKLKSLALDDATNWHPEAFEFPPDLRRLSLRNCPMFEELPPSIGELKKLEVMDLSDTKIKELPESVKELENLKTLKMVRTHLQKFPKGIMNLKNLKEIDFSFCKNLEGNIRCYISGLSSLRFLRLTSSNMAGLSNSIGRLCHRLQDLDILECNQLHELPKLPSSLVSLRWGSKIMTVTDLSYLTYLKELCLRDSEQPKAGLLNQETPDIKWITRLTSLESLELSLRNVSKLPGNFSDLTQLRELSLSYMKELDLTQFYSSSSLWTLRLKHCKIPELKFSSLKHLSELELEDCDLAQIDGLEDLKLLELLKVFHCNRIINLNGLKDLRRLRKVQVFPFDADRFSELRECGCEVDTCIPPSSRSVAG